MAEGRISIEVPMKNMRYAVPAAIAVIALCFGWIAFAAPEKKDGNLPVLFVQSSAAATLKDGKLTLMSPSTVFISDRPARLAGHVPCHNFIQAWSNGDDSFQKDPPNAVLSSFVPNGEPKKVAITLQNPRFEGPNLIYDVNILRGSAPEGMKEAVLFIDDIRLSARSWPGGDTSCFPGGIECSANGG
jgi:hypothetical protein